MGVLHLTNLSLSLSFRMERSFPVKTTAVLLMAEWAISSSRPEEKQFVGM